MLQTIEIYVKHHVLIEEDKILNKKTMVKEKSANHFAETRK